jgi:hypothetical protein
MIQVGTPGDIPQITNVPTTKIENQLSVAACLDVRWPALKSPMKSV